MGKSKKGKIIVIEGIDGAGIETQGKLLLDYLEKQEIAVERLYYPSYIQPIGKLIHEYLHKKYDFPVDVQFLLYFADFIKDKEKIQKWLKEGKIVLCDRYFTSTLAYQVLRGFSLEKALRVAKIFELPMPDLAVYLKVSVETSIKRKLKEKNSLDRNEANKEFLIKVGRSYNKLIKKQVFCKWKVVDGENSIEKVFEEIRSQIYIHPVSKHLTGRAWPRIFANK